MCTWEDTVNYNEKISNSKPSYVSFIVIEWLASFMDRWDVSDIFSKLFSISLDIKSSSEEKFWYWTNIDIISRGLYSIVNRISDYTKTKDLGFDI
jgi:hypothetical protein